MIKKILAALAAATVLSGWAQAPRVKKLTELQHAS